jgi:predicted ester cyclase
MSTPLEMARGHYAASEAGDFETDEELFDPNVETITPMGTLKGWDEFRAMNEGMKAAISEMHFEILRSFTDGDTVVVEAVFTGRHTGPMQTPNGEIAPTGNAVSFPFVDCFQVRDGRCVSHRVYWDNMAMMAQMGALG